MFNEQNKTILVYKWAKRNKRLMKWTKLLNLAKYEKWKM